MECDVPGGGGGVGMCNVSLRCLGILRQSVLGPVFSQLCAWVWSMCVWGGQKSRVCRVFCIVVSMCFGIRVLRPCSVFLVPGHTSRGILTAKTTAVLSLSHTHSSTTHSTTYISWRRHRIPFQIWEKECVYQVLVLGTTYISDLYTMYLLSRYLSMFCRN